MFKVIRDGVETPHLLMMCDSACGSVITAPVTQGMEFDAGLHQAFIANAVEHGWTFRLDKQFCPNHGKPGAMVRVASTIPN